MDKEVENIVPTEEQKENFQESLNAAKEEAEVDGPEGKSINAPSEEEVAAFKKEHVKVYGSSLAGFLFLYRGITLEEYQGIIEKASKNPAFKADQAIIDTCVLWPKEAPDLTGKEGVIPSLAGAIVLASGFDNNPEIVEF